MKAYIVIAENGKTVCESDDLFHALRLLKREPPGAKLIRTEDRKTLAYTTMPKLELDDEEGRPSGRRRKSPT
jgi:hypothetical protein